VRMSREQKASWMLYNESIEPALRITWEQTDTTPRLIGKEWSSPFLMSTVSGRLSQSANHDQSFMLHRNVCDQYRSATEPGGEANISTFR
jgi:hypothetical protein